jgi:tRNA-2-methylthio-N6-dimethylallyladenosine synthase
MSASLSGLKVFVRTFGCQMNENDSEHIAGVLTAAGAVKAGRPEDADIVVVNTCAVRQKSEEKLYSYLGRLARLKKKRPFLLGVAGCVAQVRKAGLVEKLPFVDFVAGPDNYLDLAETVGRAAEAPVIRTEFGRDWKEIGAAATVRETPWSAFVPVMEGCDNFCAYCIVPFSRGREKFRPLPNVLEEARAAAAGARSRSSSSARTSIPTGTRCPGRVSPACSRRSRPFPAWNGFASSRPTRRTSATTSSGPWPRTRKSAGRSTSRCSPDRPASSSA